MPATWLKMTADRSAAPYDGRTYLLAVPHTVGGSREQLDPDEPYSVYLGRWDKENERWVTTETDDESGRAYLLGSGAPVLYIEYACVAESLGERLH